MAISELMRPDQIETTVPAESLDATREVTQVNGIINPENVDAYTLALIRNAQFKRAQRSIMSEEGWEKRKCAMYALKTERRERYVASRIEEDIKAGLR